jgi:hypothetical protein
MHNCLPIQAHEHLEYRPLGCNTGAIITCSMWFLMINQIHLLHHHISHEVLIPNWPIQNW